MKEVRYNEKKRSQLRRSWKGSGTWKALGLNPGSNFKFFWASTSSTVKMNIESYVRDLVKALNEKTCENTRHVVSTSWVYSLLKPQHLTHGLTEVFVEQISLLLMNKWQMLKKKNPNLPFLQFPSYLQPWPIFSHSTKHLLSYQIYFFYVYHLSPHTRW